MDTIEAIILGIVQGLTEFLPVSSSGHLQIAKALMGVEIKQGDTPEVLQRRIMEQAEWIIMPKAIDDIANGRIKVEDGKVIYL